MQIGSLAFKHIGKPFAIAVFFVLLALLWSLPLQHVFAYPFVFLFLAAVMCSAWFGGFVAGILAVAMSSFLVGFLFLPPEFSLAISYPYWSYEAGFILCAVALTAVMAARKRTESTIRSSRDELELRVRERTAELELSNQEIRQRERQLRLLTEAIPQQIWRADKEGTIVYANRDLLAHLGCGMEELASNGLGQVFHTDDTAQMASEWERGRATHRAFEMKARIRGGDGTYRWFLVRANPQFDEEGRVACWYGVHIDIEGQEKARQELLWSQERLSHISHTMSMAEMAASIAHELNQPLTAILSDAHACRRWLQMEPPNLERAAATAERIANDSTRASQVVTRVRSLFSRTDYVREPADLNELIREFARVLRDEAMRHNVTVKLQLAEALPPIHLDGVQIQQVLLNLALNGMEAMAQEGCLRELEISTTVLSAGEVQVTVRDHGAGMAPESMARVFEPFFTTKPGGTGMGLAICHSIIEEHEGRIWVERLEDGTAVHFTLKPQA